MIGKDTQNNTGTGNRYSVLLCISNLQNQKRREKSPHGCSSYVRTTTANTIGGFATLSTLTGPNVRHLNSRLLVICFVNCKVECHCQVHLDELHPF